MGKREFWGLDFETSGTSHERHVPIQLGICAPDGAMASWLINGWTWLDDDMRDPLYGARPGENCWLWDERAQDIHGITKERLKRDGQSIAEVTAEAVEFIKAHSNAWHGERKLVGWNVGSFDAPFLHKHLPGIARVLSYQSADLNGLCFAISKAHGISYKNVKQQAQEAGGRRAEAVTWNEVDTWKLHDAGYDAIAALGAWDYLTARIRNGY